MKIIGAGLSGLLAGVMFPGSTIYERQGSLPHNHGAILRFRGYAISQAVGIPFKRVKVTKSIWLDGQEVQPTPRIQNMYSHKVLGEYSARSIRDISTVNRYIAPDDFIEQLAKRCNIVYNRAWPMVPGIDSLITDDPMISTIPMPVMLKQMDIEYDLDFDHQPIWTRTYEIDNAHIYQTIYYPDLDTSLYRASFTRNKLICEFINDPAFSGINYPEIAKSFGIYEDQFGDAIASHNEQKYGKIVAIDNDIRRSIMAQLTHDFNIYSLGRFATWRNVLLDDVFDDIFRIKDLINLHPYDRKLALAEEK